MTPINMQAELTSLAIVVPVYNEECYIPEFVTSIDAHCLQWKCKIELIFVDDGSIDNTDLILSSLSSKNIQLTGLRLSRRFGKEAAILAGIDHSQHDVVIVMDGDFEHPLQYIQNMLDTWRDGAQVVRMRRTQRDADPLWRKLLTRWFYNVVLPISDVDLVEGVGDFCLLDRCVVEAIQKLPERNRMFKGLVSWCGFDTTTLAYSPDRRVYGNSRWGVSSLFQLGLVAITSFSTLPLKVWGSLGGFLILASTVCLSYFLYLEQVQENPVSALNYIVTTIIFFGGIQLVCLGVLGEYIGKIYTEVRNRPNYLINARNKKTNHDEDSVEHSLSCQARSQKVHSITSSVPTAQASGEVSKTSGN